jgi:hypothetical protein
MPLTASPSWAFCRQLLLPSGGQAVGLNLLVIVGCGPLRFDPLLTFQAVKCRIQ